MALSVLSLVVLVLTFFGFFGCSASPRDSFDPPRAAPADAGVAEDDAGEAPVIDNVEIVKGVPDKNRDPAVVALDIDGTGLCTGALVSPRIVLTARHCVSRTVESVSCPPGSAQITGEHDPRTIAVLLGDDVASARVAAHGVAIVAPAGITLCDADIAYLLLDAPITGVKPLPIRTRGPAVGDRLRAVGYGRAHDRSPAGEKLVREHVKVLGVTFAEFTVGEATCQGDSGGPALDEDSGEIAGVVSRGGPRCEGPNVHNIYTRTDVFAWLTADAFTRAAALEKGGDAGTGTAPVGSKQKPPSDVGGPCETGDDCAAGVCVTEGERRYCSRPCGAGDRCPTRYHCKTIGTAPPTCINVR